jgi:hypothetical protein
VTLDPQHLVSEAVSTGKNGKPELCCIFCERIKPFSSIIALWSHFVHQHYEPKNRAYAKKIEEVRLLEEIRRTAYLWQTYWLRYSDGGKKANPTMAKLNQVVSGDFTWNSVLDWNLR